MKIIKSSNYLVNTDIELLSLLVNQLREKGLERLDQVEGALAKLNITDFNSLLKYTSGAECDDELAFLCENIIERLRAAVPDREAVLTSSSEVGMYLMDKLAGRKQEELWAIYVDNSNHIVAEKRLFQGTLDKSIAHPREIFRWAVLYACAGIFVVHNHPSGKLIPSESDIELTRILNSAADMLHIDFLDHFIVGKGRYLSMREQQLF